MHKLNSVENCSTFSHKRRCPVYSESDNKLTIVSVTVNDLCHFESGSIDLRIVHYNIYSSGLVWHLLSHFWHTHSKLAINSLCTETFSKRKDTHLLIENIKGQLQIMKNGTLITGGLKTVNITETHNSVVQCVQNVADHSKSGLDSGSSLILNKKNIKITK